MTSDRAKNSQGKILIVDDNPANLKLLYDLLAEAGFKVVVAGNGKRAIQVVENAHPDLILLDVMMPGMDGFDTCTLMKANPLTSDIPIIFMTALSETIDKIKGLNLGAVDYITKPFQIEEVLARVRVHLKMRNLTKLLQQKNSLLQQEIQERKLIQEALQESEQKYRVLVETSQDIIFSCDAQGRFTFVNQAVKKIHGYEPEEMIGRLFTDFVPLEQLTKDQEIFQRILVGESFFQYETIHIAKDGRQINLLFNAIVLRDTQGNVLGTTGTASDITQRKQAEATLQKALITADAANRAKSEFLSKMSHELRTPLNVILGFTQILARDRSLTPEQQENLSIINRAGEHLLALINDVLEMSKIEAGRIELHENSFDLYRLLDELEEMFKLKAESKGIQLIFQRVSPLPQSIKADESKLRQVLINLLGNALKFTDKGSVTLRLRAEVNIKIDSPTPMIFEQQLLHFEVEDTGSGIASEELTTLFNPFVQTETVKNAQSGTGLGLPISRQFIQMMGGNITIKSTVGQGTIFQFYISIKPAQADEISPPKSSRKVISLEPNQPEYRILIVDDIWEIRLLLFNLLSPIGFKVRQAANGQEAVKIWQEWQPHLIWMDMQMPIMDGYEATKKIKSQLTISSPIIIGLTASAFPENHTKVLAAGCDDFVSKPFREEVIFDKMANHLGISYLYENLHLKPSAISSLPKSTALYELTPKDLAIMPKEWVAQLYQAACSLDEELIIKLDKQIPSNNSILANALDDLATKFRFDKIIDLIQNIPYE